MSKRFSVRQPFLGCKSTFTHIYPVSLQVKRTKDFNSLIHSLLGHFAVSGPFPSCHREQTGVTDMDQVISNQRSRILCIGIAHKWANTSPCRKHITTTNFEIWTEIMRSFIQNETDFFFCWLGVKCHLGGCICRASNRISFLQRV